ncbi:double-strand break repair protein AddB [Palleronia aestuarii]|uniref:Double-strand break repair protein AddB n=1 Tax=Palleronia aestuarii TaxID=568105 RepID=A0A2W7NFJ1_9RHOB|nr:double-strand break repair protein AddB [Palleronia aestuarii]PZX18988.1 double-strand break repair protein AddB [Palleronia aestuarii]
MFETDTRPRLFGLPPGADFPAGLVSGLEDRLGHRPPQDWARCRLFVNTRRMQRRLVEIFAAGPARLLPRIRLVTDLAADPALDDLPQSASALRRRLELARLVGALIERDPRLAPEGAVFDLADSLAVLLDEMQGEGVPPEKLRALDVSDLSGHWQRALAFIDIVGRYFEGEAPLDPEARQRRAVERLAARWETDPPDHPVILAGSTGSRGATALLMRAVARLPQGAVILPGFDFTLPGDIWEALGDPMASEDHPQYRFARLVADLGLSPQDVECWHGADPVPARNRLVSMALRPAPVTDQWMRDGPSLGDLVAATEHMSLIEAPDTRAEALSIALVLRDAAERGVTAALITPDRMLSRQVTAALDRWRIVPDDSAGRPLALSAPGRLLRQIAHEMGQRMTPEALLGLLKHPLVHTGEAGRGDHLRRTRDLELWLRRTGAPFPDIASLKEWADKREDPGVTDWISWLETTVFALDAIDTAALATLVARHRSLAEALARGPTGHGSGALWEAEAGPKARAVMDAIDIDADAGGDMTPRDYARLFDSVMNGAEPVREAARTHPDIMIWGTLEARVQGADLVILGGLSEGTWPERPAPDPWLNRKMRHEAGLLLPDRRIGLAAHDFQQAVAAPEVVITRALRDAEAESVASRWLNRLTNLLNGLPLTRGPEALAGMRARGRRWLDLAAHLDGATIPAPRARRPSPCPPVAARPDRLSITEVQTLVRDPYAIYARHVLGLAALDPLRPEPDARLRGIVFHEILEHAFGPDHAPDDPDAAKRFLHHADAVLAAEVPWPSTRALFRARLARLANWMVEGERRRRMDAAPVALERRATYPVPGTGVTLHGKADRIDRRVDGTLVLYDYKTGKAPTPKEMQLFDRQLLLEAIIAEAGGFEGVEAGRVGAICHISLGTSPSDTPHDLRDPDAKHSFDPDATLADLTALLQAYASPEKGYTSRRLMQRMGHSYDFDHLARHGEWGESDEPHPERVG